MVDIRRNTLKGELSLLYEKGGDPESVRVFFRTFKDLDELVIKCLLWGHTFMPRYFSKATPEFHYELVRRFFRKSNDYTACPRGFGKTSINQLCIAFSCVNGLDEFIVLIEKSWNEAAEVLEAIRDEFKLNDEILRVYGDLSKVNAKGNDQEGLKDSAGDFFVNGIRLRAKGFDAPIRGLKSRHSRPTRIILDDIESDEHIENVDQRAKYLNNYIKGVIPAVDNDTGVIKMVGTILHDDSLLNTLINNHNGKVYAAWDKDHKLLWESNWTVEKLEQKREEMRIEGKGDSAFYQEYFNQPLSDEDQIFRREMFRYFNALDLEKIRKKPHRIYTLVDPAISKRTTADFTVVVTVLIDYMNRIFVLEITRERLDPIETIKVIFAHYTKWMPIYVGIETVSYQKALKYFIEQEKRREQSIVQGMQIVEIKPTTDKITKISGLQAFYGIGSVYHNSDDKNTVILEEELTRFPKAVHDDIADGLSSVIAIMVPVSKTVDRSYKKFINARNSGSRVMY
jgi:phage terminase large subunit-like protein